MLMHENRSVSVPSGRFVALDGFRGVAALIVAIGHYGGTFPAYLAVDFFLILSGFVLTHRYMYSTRVTFREFVIARLARLYPLHLLTLCLLAGVLLLRHGHFPHYEDGTAFTFVLHLVLLQNVGLAISEQTWNIPSWSISVEFWVNIVFFSLITKRTSTWLMIILSFALFSLIAIQSGRLAVSLPNYLFLFNSGLIRGFASFLLGIVAYRMYLDRQRLGTHRAPGHFWRIAVLLVACLLVLVPRPGMDWMDFLAPPTFFACVVLYAGTDSGTSRWMRCLAYLGGISYSIYLVHYPVIQFMPFLRAVLRHKGWDNGPGLLFVDPGLALIPYLMLVLVLSHVLYRWFEVPSRSAIKKVFSNSVVRNA